VAFVIVALVPNKLVVLVDEAFVVEAFSVVKFPVVPQRVVTYAVSAESKLEKRLVVVALLIDAFVENKLVVVAFVEVEFVEIDEEASVVEEYNVCRLVVPEIEVEEDTIKQVAGVQVLSRATGSRVWFGEKLVAANEYPNVDNANDKVIIFFKFIYI
jgi:hypothetical protein